LRVSFVVILQTYHHGAMALKPGGGQSALVIVAIAATAWGFARLVIQRKNEKQENVSTIISLSPGRIAEGSGRYARTTRGDAKLLAGGQSLIPLLKLRFANPEHLVDLNFIVGTSFIKEDSNSLHFGSMIATPRSNIPI